LLLSVMIVVLAIAGAGEAWKRWGSLATASDDYVVTPAKISITPQPNWIHADVKGEVIRDASLSRLELRDPAVLEKVSQAFAMHSWVAKVKRVQKSFPAQLDVEIEYRRPVAMVEVNPNGRPGLLFIDAQGVLLPSEDFASNQARSYLRVAAGDVAPAGLYGTPWGSEKIAGAGRLAAAWGERWKPLDLYRIVVSEEPKSEITYELQTQGGARILWGHAPGSEVKHEPRAQAKIDRLLAWAGKTPLDHSGDRPLIDLRFDVKPDSS